MIRFNIEDTVRTLHCVDVVLNTLCVWQTVLNLAFWHQVTDSDIVSTFYSRSFFSSCCSSFLTFYSYIHMPWQMNQFHERPIHLSTRQVHHIKNIQWQIWRKTVSYSWWRFLPGHQVATHTELPYISSFYEWSARRPILPSLIFSPHTIQLSTGSKLNVWILTVFLWSFLPISKWARHLSPHLPSYPPIALKRILMWLYAIYYWNSLIKWWNPQASNTQRGKMPLKSKGEECMDG